MKTYPRKGLDRRARPTQKCQVCRVGSAAVTLDIETSIFRGDDKSLRVCDACRRLTAEQILAKLQEAAR